MGKITEQAKKILKQFPIIEELPASISGKYHLGETAREHVERCASIVRHLCDEFKINEEDADMLIACAYLHDLGTYLISAKGEVYTLNPKLKGNTLDPIIIGKIKHYKYFERTGFSKLNYLNKLHPIISAEILEYFEIDRKKEIQEIIITHMSHWYPNCPQPETFYQQLLCIADYLSTRKDLFGYQGNRTNEER